MVWEDGGREAPSYPIAWRRAAPKRQSYAVYLEQGLVALTERYNLLNQ